MQKEANRYFQSVEFDTIWSTVSKELKNSPLADKIRNMIEEYMIAYETADHNPNHFIGIETNRIRREDDLEEFYSHFVTERQDETVHYEFTSIPGQNFVMYSKASGGTEAECHMDEYTHVKQCYVIESNDQKRYYIQDMIITDCRLLCSSVNAYDEEGNLLGKEEAKSYNHVQVKKFHL